MHPGVGFLAENADFAEIVAAHGLTFIGPEPRHIRSMGDKVEAKITAADSGLPLVPGSPGAVHTLDEARTIGADVGYPLLVKAASGGNDTLREIYDEARAALTDRIFREDAQGTIIAETPRTRLLVRGWAAMAEELVLGWKADPQGVTREEVLEMLVASLPALVAAIPTD